MNKEFSIKQIAQIAIKLRQFSKLYVTTEGQMFVNKADAEEAVRVKNMIIDDQNEYVGILEMTESQVTSDRLKEFAKEPEKFNELFDGAKIPVIKKSSSSKHERKRETRTEDATDVVADITESLGLTNDTEAEVMSESSNADQKKAEVMSESSNVDEKKNKLFK